MNKAAGHVFQGRADHGLGAEYVVPVLLLITPAPQAGVTRHVKNRIRGSGHDQGKFGGIVQWCLDDRYALLGM